LVNVKRDSGSQVVLVTAALPGEGKSWVAVSLAVSLAAEGFRVALVDCDLHRPTVHRMFDGPRSPGLSDYFAGEAAVPKVVHLESVSGVEYVPVGSRSSSKAWRITLDRLSRLVAQLQGMYQFIILDSAPVLAASETAMLSQIAQKTIFVVRWGNTPAQIARHAMAQLLDSGAARVAVLLSMVDINWAAKHGDVVAGAYRRLQSYYVDSAGG
jgi:Mrp family chromosome partitioning ATPase